MAMLVAVMTTFPAAAAMTFGRGAIGTVVMRFLGMAGTAAMVVQRRRHRIGEQIARQHDPNWDFPQNGHNRGLKRQTSTDSHIHTSLRAFPLECNSSVFRLPGDRHEFNLPDCRLSLRERTLFRGGKATITLAQWQTERHSLQSWFHRYKVGGDRPVETAQSRPAGKPFIPARTLRWTDASFASLLQNVHLSFKRHFRLATASIS